VLDASFACLRRTVSAIIAEADKAAPPEVAACLFILRSALYVGPFRKWLVPVVSVPERSRRDRHSGCQVNHRSTSLDVLAGG
jgi:hypothetical protein